MKKTRRIISVWIAAMLVLLLFASCGQQEAAVTQTAPDSDAAAALAGQPSVEVDDTDSTLIAFNGETATITGSGASADGADVTVNSGGVYTVRGTTTNGRIVVDAADEEVALVLENTQIACADSSAIYVVEAKLVTVYAKNGTKNTLTDGRTYFYGVEDSSEQHTEPNACLYSKADLILAGAGALTVNGQLENGVTSRDTLRIEDLTLQVDAVNHGVIGKDSLTVKDAVVTVNAGGDAMRSTNADDETFGHIVMSGATLTLTSGGDGIQAESNIVLGTTTATITASGGNSATLDNDESAKGVKAGTDLMIDGCSMTLNSAEDGVHADRNVTINSGTLTIQSGDDGIHADDTVTIKEGEITITAHEGIEGTLVTIDGGKISISASDDGINAGQKDSGVTPTVTINGGELTIEMAQGDTDGIDSNGDIIIGGGTIRITAQSAFDYDGKGELNGGTVFVNGKQVTELENQFGGVGDDTGEGKTDQRP